MREGAISKLLFIYSRAQMRISEGVDEQNILALQKLPEPLKAILIMVQSITLLGTPPRSVPHFIFFG